MLLVSILITRLEMFAYYYFIISFLLSDSMFVGLSIL